MAVPCAKIDRVSLACFDGRNQTSRRNAVHAQQIHIRGVIKKFWERAPKNENHAPLDFFFRLLLLFLNLSVEISFCRFEFVKPSSCFLFWLRLANEWQLCQQVPPGTAPWTTQLHLSPLQLTYNHTPPPQYVTSCTTSSVHFFHVTDDPSVFAHTARSSC